MRRTILIIVGAFLLIAIFVPMLLPVGIPSSVFYCLSRLIRAMDKYERKPKPAKPESISPESLVIDALLKQKNESN